MLLSAKLFAAEVTGVKHFSLLFFFFMKSINVSSTCSEDVSIISQLYRDITLAPGGRWLFFNQDSMAFLRRLCIVWDLP